MRMGPVAVTVARVAKEIELRRHTDADEDVLTAEGVAAALEIAHASEATTSSRSRPARSVRPRRSPASSPPSASKCRSASWSSRACARRLRTAGARPTRRLVAAHSGPYARPILSSSRKTRSGSAPRSDASSTACPTAAVPSSSATARRMRPPSLALPVRSRRRSRRGGVRVVARDDGYQVEPLA